MQVKRRINSAEAKEERLDTVLAKPLLLETAKRLYDLRKAVGRQAAAL
jgi:hypothetical protein